MTNRQSLCMCLFIFGVILLPGCGSSMGIWQAYPGKKLPNKETALIKRGSDLAYWNIDGEKVLDEYFTHELPIGMALSSPLLRWVRKEARVLPGEHEIGTGYPFNGITFNAEAGRVYTLFGKQVEESDLVWKGEELGYVVEGDRHCYVWIKDESGSVIAGKKPPEDETAKAIRD